MSQVALFVDIEIEPGQVDAFAALIRAHAAGTLVEEEGCLAFTVGVDREAPTHFWLFELYRDQAAVDAHRASARLVRFRESLTSMRRDMRRIETDILAP